ncbi:MAG: polymer-forming cytoskeletal protein [Bacteroidales bacterium]|jgi:cytoskeletal protein CcmA (bactofilin family)|nr:polymer-forming cytoskeletal protein [Bacteroidales bacterium]
MTKQNANYSDTSNQAINIISEGTDIKGDITALGDIRIDGTLIGKVETKGRLVIGPKGKIEGEINCNSIEVSGLIKGKVVVQELFNMKSSAQVFGDIIIGKLSIEPGSVFTGNCSMGNNKPDK